MSAKQQAVRVAIVQSALPVGELVYSKEGRREFSAFSYDETWLATANRFEISPDLALIARLSIPQSAQQGKLPVP
ncbi:MAG: hypothetical protein ACR5LC_03175 [Symbiopectobacterium sp.]|uniref:hypothetical protein n=1 Tax=Symbiopectobacterium sp. TaxID=2952789 RepID=UPI003F3431B1